MLRSLTSAISGLQNFQTRMDVIGNNIANVNTIGYKGARTDFADSFSQTLRESSSGNSTSAGQAAMQIGSGMTVNAIKNVYTQGAINRTGVLTDLAIEGDGFFMVHDSIGNEDFVTRAGNFRVDANGYLVTESGMNVQGYSDAALATIGNIKIDVAGADPAWTNPEMSSFSIDAQGLIKVKLKDGNEFVRGQILLQGFTDPQGLVKRGNNLFSGMSAAGATGPLTPGSAGVGKMQAGALELSNVELASEFSNMITAQRAFQATARVITTSDEMLQELVNLKR